MEKHQGDNVFNIDDSSSSNFLELSLTEMDVIDPLIKIAGNMFFLGLLPIQNRINDRLNVNYFPIVFFGQHVSNRPLPTLFHPIDDNIESFRQFRLKLKELPGISQKLILRILIIKQKHSPCIGTGELSLAIDNLAVQQLNGVSLLPKRPPPQHFRLLNSLIKQILFPSWF